jgi:hypothetical protein
MRRTIIAALVCGLAMACSKDRDGDDGSDGGIGDGGADDGGSGDGDGGGGGDGEEIFDVGTGDGDGNGGDTEDDRCKRLDFLFVIDSSNSLNEEQANLIGSFPGFVASIQATLSDVDDYHVGVVTSDPYAFNAPGCTEIGALVTQTGGKDSSESVCDPFADGFRFMTENDDLGARFACTAQVGTGGLNDEAMMQAATRAIAPDINGAGGCNESFIRSDALLILVLITDEDDPGTCIMGNIDCTGSPGDPQTWYDNMVMIKEVASNIVVLSLVWGAPGNVCGPPPGTEKLGERIMEFTQMFANGFIGDICAPSYDGFFQDAVDAIDVACDDFTPPG